MKREIKFEIWSKEQKTMLSSEEVSWLDLRLDGEKFSARQDGKLLFTHKNAELRQFIGLKDKNGKEIYDGDILQGRGGKKVIIKFDDSLGHCGSCCGPAFDATGFSVGDGCYRITGEFIAEIIGNIFTNPEMSK